MFCKAHAISFVIPFSLTLVSCEDKEGMARIEALTQEENEQRIVIEELTSEMRDLQRTLKKEKVKAPTTDLEALEVKIEEEEGKVKVLEGELADLKSELSRERQKLVSFKAKYVIKK